MEAKGPAHFDFLGHDQVLRNRDIAAEAELDQNAARLEHLEPRANGPFVSGRFELDIELAARIRPQRRTSLRPSRGHARCRSTSSTVSSSALPLRRTNE